MPGNRDTDIKNRCTDTGWGVERKRKVGQIGKGLTERCTDIYTLPWVTQIASGRLKLYCTELSSAPVMTWRGGWGKRGQEGGYTYIYTYGQSTLLYSRN